MLSIFYFFETVLVPVGGGNGPSEQIAPDWSHDEMIQMGAFQDKVSVIRLPCNSYVVSVTLLPAATSAQ